MGSAAKDEVVFSDIRLKTIKSADYDELIRLWKGIKGLGLSSADEKENLEAFFERNPDLSFAASRDGKIIGTVLAGHDGRRGFLYHLCVAAEERKRGLGRLLAERALSELGKIGIGKCHVLVFADNDEGKEFWTRLGFKYRSDIALFSKEL